MQRAIPDSFDLSPTDDAAIRRAVRTAGYLLRKSRWRYDSIDNFGGYRIVDPDTNCVAAGFRVDMTGADVAGWLMD